ncbi:MAG: DUF1549 and DUF1553 domain-containing protein, partial [Bryobacteraceae bacterium]
RLDGKTAALAKLAVPGKSTASPLYQRVAGLNGLVRMPMGGKLSPADIARIKTWIDEGAVWPDGVGAKIEETKTHWAFIPPVRPPVPVVSNPRWTANPIDNFVLARLDKDGLAPSPEADRPTLLRRVSLDLTGLPPTPAEVDAFVKDKSKNAYEKQVDRLLSSPHYGERWARVWLDAARYADSNGYEKDRPRDVWFYRDWVIKALNRNLPYNQFIIDQIAGDELPHATEDQIVATGFLRNSMINEEGGVDPEQFRMESMFDRMDAIGKGILGVTIQCAQCHNHKFDPLKQVEYYRMLAFLNNTNEADIGVYTPQQEMQRAEVYRKTREMEAALRHRNPDWKVRMAEWEKTVTGNQPVWTVLHAQVDDNSTGGQKYEKLDDGSFLAGGYAPTSLKLKLTAKTDAQDITAFRLELLNDANLPHGGPGRSQKGMCVLSEFAVDAAPAATPDKSVRIKFAKATADISLPSTEMPAAFQPKTGKRKLVGPVDFAIDGKGETGWNIDAGPGQRNQSRKAVFTVAAPISNAGGSVLTFYLSQNQGGANSDNSDNNNIGRFRLSYTTSPDAAADPLPQMVRQALAIPSADRTPEQVETIFRYWRTTVSAWRETNDQIATLWKEYPEGESQLVLADRQKTRDTHVLMRGDFLKPEQVVTPGVPAFLNPLPPNAPPTRLTFAKWMVDRKAPTTARSFVNRVWQSDFGIGIVATAENFGTQCEPPSHPQLLDWLAVQFMDSGWDIKALQRLIVESATYRQASNVTPALLEKDPYNRLLARGPRFRVDAEIVRDIALEASGLLNPQVGGPSVFPPAPAFLFKPPASYAPKVWKEDTGPERYRRALYTFRYRSVPYPMLQAFDAPNGDASCVRRARSNTPLQALTTLNEPLFVESARALAMRTLRDGGRNDRQRIAYAFRRCVARKPTGDESSELLSLLEKEQQHFSDGKLNPWELAAGDPAHPPELPKGATAPELAAWTAVSRVLLNLDETITKE